MSDNIDKNEFDEEAAPAKKGMKLPVLIGLILGIIVVQVGIVMAAIKFFAPESANAKAKTEEAAKHKESSEHAEGEETTEEDGAMVTVAKVGGIISTKSDLYINPKGGSNHIVVLSLGIEVSPEEKKEEVAEKLMVPIQDRVIARISSYTAEQLQNGVFRDSLRSIIKDDIQPYFRGLSEEGKEQVKLRRVYFPKFIIQ